MTLHSLSSRDKSLDAAGLPSGNGFELAFHISPTPMLMLETGQFRIIEANAAAGALLGASNGELPEANFLHFIADEGGVKGFVGALPKLGPAVSPPMGQSLELTLRRRDGAPVRATAAAVICRLAGGKPGFLVQLERAGAVTSTPLNPELPTAGLVTQHLIECIGDGFLVLGGDGVVTYANASAARILGTLRRNLVGHRLDEIFPHLNRDDLARASQAFSSDTPAQAVRIPIFFGCELHHFEFGVHPHQHGMGVLFRDVSESIKQEMEIAKLNATMAVSQELLRSKNEELNSSLEKLARLNEQLENADKLKSEFLANTSHELRTPLNSTIGFLQLISEGLCESREEELEYVRNALISSQHLLALINDVLDIAKIEAGKMTLLIDDIDMDNIFHEVFSMTHVQAQQKGLQLSFEVRDENDRIARADFHKVKQVLVNLIGNSIKFTDSGFIRVWVESDPERADMLLVCVQDSGIGVSPFMQQSIFKTFTQGDGASTRKYNGTGLGLAISKNLVEMMGGSISLYSEGERKGTMMRFSLPKGIRQQRPADSDACDHENIDELLPKTF